MYLLPKIHKSLNDIPGRPIISNCGIPMENLSESLNHHLQPIMKAGKSCIKDIGDFLEKLKNLGNVPSNAILAIADVVGLYPSIPYNAGLQALHEKLGEKADKKIPSTDLNKMAEFILENNFFDLKLKFETKFLELPLELCLPSICMFIHE